MQFIALFLLIGCLSITTAGRITVSQIKKEIQLLVENEEENFIQLDDHVLKFVGVCLDSTGKAVIWKASFDDKEVAVKIFTFVSDMNKEKAAYEALDAMDNPKTAKYRIPKIYYFGEIFSTHPIIVMTLFDGNLFTRWIAQKKKFNIYSTLQVFLQSVKALKYLRRKRVVHNDIKPQNIFLRGRGVFIADFDLATIDGAQSSGYTTNFASTGCWSGQNRTAMDDLESLVYTIWYIEKVDSNQPDGFMIFNQSEAGNKQTTENIDFVLEKCAHFAEFPEAHDACVFICKDEMLSGKPVPEYDRIIEHLEAAIKQVEIETNQTEFEWLPLEPVPLAPLASCAVSITCGSLVLGCGKKKST